MKEKIKLAEYAGKINEELRRGILLNTNGDKFNSMSIGWGALGILWNTPVFTVYVRESRYTKSQLDKTGEFTLSIPLGERDPVIDRVCGSLSGRDIDKTAEAKLALEPPNANSVPGIAQYPLTVECRVIYREQQKLGLIPPAMRARFYPEGTPGCSAEQADPHTMYIGEVLDAYVIHPDRPAVKEESMNVFFRKNDINAGIVEFKNTEGAVLIDVRDEDEFASGHIPGAVNIPLSRLREVEDSVDDYDTPIFTYCLSGVRSSRSVPALNMIGYTNVRSIGGIEDYKGPLER